MFSEQANTLQESLRTLSNASIEFMKFSEVNDYNGMMKATNTGVSNLLSMVQIILAYRDEASLAKDKKFTKDSVGLIFQDGITENLKQSVFKDKDKSLIGLKSSVPTFNELLNKIKHGEFKKSTFSIVNNEHILFISGKKFMKQPDYVIRFSVQDIYNFCQNYIAEIDSYYR